MLCVRALAAGRAYLRPRAWMGGYARPFAAESINKNWVINDAIQTDKVRLVIKDEATGKNSTSIVTRDEALAKAKSMKLDLVLVSNASQPWVCKLLNIKREMYIKEKKERRIKRAAQTTKELTIKGNISEHDLMTKLKRVTDFFAQGHAVRLTIMPVYVQTKTKPQRLQELRDFILEKHLVNKLKNFVEIEPPPGSLKREMVLYPKRGSGGGGGAPTPQGGGGGGKPQKKPAEKDQAAAQASSNPQSE